MKRVDPSPESNAVRCPKLYDKYSRLPYVPPRTGRECDWPAYVSPITQEVKREAAGK